MSLASAATAGGLSAPAPGDAERASRLRRMKAVALGLLLVAAVVFLLTLGHQGFWGFVNAAAEASMVGAMADWFAVTALFRHPLGLPVPHTALVPRHKDDFGQSLETFFTENFLAEENVRGRLASADVVGRVARWVVVPENAERVADEMTTVARTGLQRLRDDDVAALVEQTLLPRLVQEPISPVAGRLLQEIVADDAHRAMVDLTLDEAHRWLVHNQETFTQVVGERAPWWAPDRLNEAVTRRLHVEAIHWVSDIRADPDHHARKALDSMLAQLAVDLLEDEETQQRAERLKDRVLSHPQVVETGLSLWSAFRRALLEALVDADGPLRRRVRDEVIAVGDRVQGDDAFRSRLEGWLADLAVFTTERYGGELAAIITHTIRQWDGVEASRKIELYVGRDLQFIRINGTVVGGLVGLVIHAVSVVVR